MADTIREQIITAIEAKLAHILTAKGYLTECGENVHRARKSLDQSELPAVVLVPKPETSAREYNNSVNTMRIRVEALQQFDPAEENPSEVSEQLLADLIECVAGRRWSIGFDSGSYEPQPGDTIEGATSGATAAVESVTKSSGTWAAGDAAGTVYFRRLSGKFVNDELVDDGSQSNCLTINGTATYISPESSTTSDLADDIKYVGGGTEEYPEAPDTTVGVGADFEITYTTVAGDPFTRPA
jgi:hypothetical protein